MVIALRQDWLKQLQVFLGGLAATMRADADFKGGWYDPEKPPTLGPRAFSRVYAGWGFSQPFYWQQVPLLLSPATSFQSVRLPYMPCVPPSRAPQELVTNACNLRKPDLLPWLS